MEMRIIWPNGYKAALIIGIDDIHPESSKDGCDCGGDMEKGVLGSILKLVEEFSHIKVTLFITPQWMYLPQNRLIKKLMDSTKKLRIQGILNKPFIMRRLLRRWPEDRFRIDKKEYEEWATFITENIRKGVFEVGIHGLYHFQEYWPPMEEFGNLSFEECIERLRRAKELFDATGIPITPVFAPPGWKVTENLKRALVSEGISCIAGSLKGSAGIKDASWIYPEQLNNKLVNLPRNWIANYSSLEDVEQIIEKGGIIGVHAHVWQSYHGESIGSALSPQALEEWRELFQYLEQRHSEEIWYTTFNQIAEYILKG